MAKDKRPDRESDARKLDKISRKPKAEDRILDLGKLLGRKPKGKK